jgi:uncharacterized protein YcbX
VALSVEALYTNFLAEAPGVAAPRVELNTPGIPDDRSYLLYAPDMSFVGAQQAPGLRSVVTRLSEMGEVIVMTRPHGKSEWSAFQLPEPAEFSRPITINEYGVPVAAQDLGDQTAEFFAPVAGKEVRLAKRAPGLPADVVATSSTPVTIQPPLHIISDRTAEHISTLAAFDSFDHVPHFRPNIVIGGADVPGEEEKWMGATLRIGSLAVVKVAPERPADAIGVYGHPLIDRAKVQSIDVGDEVTVEP